MTDISITCPVNFQENCILVKFTGFFYAFPGFVFIFFLLLLNFLKKWLYFPDKVYIIIS